MGGVENELALGRTAWLPVRHRNHDILSRYGSMVPQDNIPSVAEVSQDWGFHFA
jgi:hypothetical protein